MTGTPPISAVHDEAGLIELDVGPIAHGGHCVARQDGRVIFVRHAIPGERVLARLTDAEPGASFWRADVVEVLEASGDRQDHPWALADALRSAAAGRLPVGGAEFGHIALPAQRALKSQVLAEQLVRLGGLADAAAAVDVEPVAGEDSEGLSWRTRVTFDVDDAGRLAMHPHRSDELIRVTDMPLAVPAIDALKLWDVEFEGVRRVEVAAPASGATPLVTLFPLGGDSADLEAVAERIDPRANVCWVDPATNELTALRGDPWVTETVDGRDYQVTGDGFWQIHRSAADTLTSAVLEFLQPRSGERVLDLYAGAGLFSAAIAEAGARVVSVESSPGTSADATVNLVPWPESDVVRSKVERFVGGGRPRGKWRRSGRGRAPQAPAWREKVDAVVVDPPRVGLDKTVVQAIVQNPPRRLVYVSCDPATFARDVGRFTRAGWTLDAVRAFDLYPMTHHLETVALLCPPKGPSRA